MKLKKVLKDVETIQVKGSKEIEITGVFTHSKVVFPGSIFIARAGSTTHGNHYIPNAIENGASCIVLDMYNPFLTGVTQVVVENPSNVLAKIASNFFEDPSMKLTMVGITGTCGKTTVSYFTKHLLEQEAITGLTGTVETFTGLKRFKSSLTTPDAPDLMKILKEMRIGKCKNCVMEVSSHGLEQGRLKETMFDVVAFLNLSHEHLDYHGTMKEYQLAKERLLAHRKKDGIAVVSLESSWGKKLKKKVPEAITFGFSKKADIYAEKVVMTKDGSTFDLCSSEEKKRVTISSIGKFNIENALAASAIAYALGISLEKIACRLETLPAVPGRMEKIKNDLGIEIIVDYAHKPDALEKVLMAIKETISGKLITVFGCGGQRDREKRPLMGSLAQKYADFAVLTNDNPRGEDPLLIIEEIKKGIKSLDYIVIEDRKEAIQFAINKAEKGDTILLAGKGHEEEQEILGQRLPLSDRTLARDMACSI
ncbi:MAG: UDP-N-acetylmuramoyl-L-alanyl-D-glutamate--2,6-diaminopimelate ligase [Chlamydiia bacterium]|nr:UDP-N-acetylmuramoyl-L-alanyl-D-glutamate--2,6-diaminopimelate ligase [Chlamydiia bacterium]